MDDPIAKRLRDLLQITMNLRENIDELLNGLSKQIERESAGTIDSASAMRPRRRSR